MTFVRQFLCTVVVSYSWLTMGLTLTWPSSTLALFRGENTTLHRPMSKAEQALLGSLSSVGALVATPAAGLLLNTKGRKFCMVWCSLMHVICWAMAIASNRVEVLFIAIFISGIGCGTFPVSPIYISDFCQESIRGQMTSGTVIFYSIGTTVSYVVGGYLDYYTMLHTCLGISIVGVLLLMFVPESPLFLMIKGREQEAKIAMAFFRNLRPDSKAVLQELETIRRGLNPEIEQLAIPEEESNLKPKAKKNLSVWQLIRNSNCTRRALAVAMVFLTLSVFQGLVVVQVYAEPLFAEAVPTMAPTSSTIIFSMVTFVASLIAAYLTDVIGRRPLMLYSSLASGVCCVLLGSQIHLHWAPHAVTAVFIYLFCVFYTLGAGTVPYVMSPELFLPEVKSFATMLVMEWVWLCSFVILFLFNPLVAAIGLGPVFYIFAFVCLASAVFTHFCLPETRGLPVDQIPGLFARKRTRVIA